MDPFSKSKDVEGQFDVVEEARVEYLGLLTLREKGVVRKGTLKKRTPSETLLIEEIRSAQLAHLREDAPGSMEMVQIPSKGQLAEDSVVDTVSEETPEFKRNTSKRKVDQLKAEHVKMWLDMDVIDNSFLDTNTSAVRHSIFVLNRSLIDDIQVGGAKPSRDKSNRFPLSSYRTSFSTENEQSAVDSVFFVG